LEYSLDGEYLASGSRDGSIRIWLAEAFHTDSSQTQIEKPLLLGSRYSASITALSFSRTDSNILASGGSNQEIKVWKVKEQACIHSFVPRSGVIRSLFFSGGADSSCIALADASIIRLWRAEGASHFASETMSPCEAVISPSGSFVAARLFSRTGNESTLALYELEAMTKTQSVVVPGFRATHIAVSLDNKQLVVGDRKGRIRLLQTDDLSIQRDLDPRGEVMSLSSIAFDPACQVLGIGSSHDGRLELRSL
jgi:WD40 repeat protein